jgi:hypothetical protein
LFVAGGAPSDMVRVWDRPPFALPEPLFRERLRVGPSGDEPRLERREVDLDAAAEEEVVATPSGSSSTNEMSRLFRGRRVEVLLLVLW